MIGAIYRGPMKITVENVEIPSIQEGELLLRVKAVGVCPTDVKVYRRGSSSVQAPRILGHEVVGEVAESRTPSVSVGERVNVAADSPCLECSNCRRGLENICTSMQSLGVNIDGGYAQFMRVPREFVDKGLVLPLPDGVSWESGALVEPVAVSLHALSLGRPRERDLTVVIGDGPNALIHTQLLKNIFHVRRVIVVGLMEHRLKQASILGADETLKVQDLGKEIGKLKEEGIDLLDLTIANEPSVREAMDLLTAGTKLVIFGGSQTDLPLRIDTNSVHYKQLTITGSTGTTVDEYRKAHQLVVAGQINLDKIISHTFSLYEIRKALEFTESQQGLKSVVIP